MNELVCWLTAMNCPTTNSIQGQDLKIQLTKELNILKQKTRTLVWIRVFC